MFVQGCKKNDSSTNVSDNINVSFTLSDTTGKLSTTFRSGEQFIVSFLLINTTSKPITYITDISPIVGFEILKNDSVIAQSEYGGNNSIPAPMLLLTGDTLQGVWKAPTSLWKPNLILAPGTYEVALWYPTFPDGGVNPIKPIEFSIIQ